MENIKFIVEYLSREGLLIYESPVIFGVILFFSILIIWNVISFIFSVRLENARSNIEKINSDNRALREKIDDLSFANQNLEKILEKLRESIAEAREKPNNAPNSGDKIEELSKILDYLMKRDKIAHYRKDGVEIQRGSNINGAFVRRSDGLQDCEGVINEVANQNGYRHFAIFPAQFLTPPKIEIFPAGFVKDIEVTEREFRYTSCSRPLPEAAILRYKAVGKWK
jgi:hypothetical protein